MQQSTSQQNQTVAQNVVQQLLGNSNSSPNEIHTVSFSKELWKNFWKMFNHKYPIFTFNPDTNNCGWSAAVGESFRIVRFHRDSGASV